MRNGFVIVVAASLVASPVMAQSSALPKASKSTSSGKVLPMKREKSVNSCAAYGPGFIKLEGSDTCVRIGGSIGVGVGGAIGGR
jgi:hypothetical protein